VTSLLEAAAAGNRDAADGLVDAVYGELRQLAAGRLAGEAPGRSVQITDLVHEAYLRLFGTPTPQRFENRAHFFAAASEAMRRILVDRARARRRLKRGGGRARVALDMAEPAIVGDPDSVLALDEALERFQQLDPRAAEIVKLRCFVGLTIAETAEALGVTSRTVNRDWLAARAWLKGALAEAPAGAPRRNGSHATGTRTRSVGAPDRDCRKSKPGDA
jgi:RNA polymerase sigma factor (TIGR02999 family)